MIFTEKKRRAGRPGTAQATVNLVMRMATENLGWGYSKILGELKKLGIRIGRTTFRDILKRKDIIRFRISSPDTLLVTGKT